jgi:Flp pilus assembly pilin Flp
MRLEMSVLGIKRGQAMVEYMILSILLSVCLLASSRKLQAAWNEFYHDTVRIVALPFF